jgi:hypothetical protein
MLWHVSRFLGLKPVYWIFPSLFVPLFLRWWYPPLLFLVVRNWYMRTLHVIKHLTMDSPRYGYSLMILSGK